MHETSIRRFAVDNLARVEGEGAMHLTIEDGTVTDLRFKIFEPPRFYEAFLRGRDFSEAPDITARICGICPVAYQTSASNAMESLLGIDIGPQLRRLRHLLYLGEWIESHALHIHLLHAPDFLGYPDGIAMAADHPDEVRRGLRMKRIGNDLMRVIGGREIHPVNPRVGGFHRAIPRDELDTLVDDLQWGLEAAEAVVSWVAQLPMPMADMDYEFVALSDPDAYAILDGRIVSSEGIDIAVAEWDDVFVEEHVEWSNALHARIRDRGSYLVGPLARHALNHDRLHPRALAAAAGVGLGPPVTNPFASIVVRAVEVVHAFATALDEIDRYERPATPFVAAPVTTGVGHGASEAPRGLLYHRYAVDGTGAISDARIVPPTSQNQKRIEDDLRIHVLAHLDLPDDRLQLELEQTIRNYDPCISCATHFLDLTVERH
jgi:sulfhydrogenase subunit alpha